MALALPKSQLTFDIQTNQFSVKSTIIVDYFLSPSWLNEKLVFKLAQREKASQLLSST